MAVVKLMLCFERRSFPLGARSNYFIEPAFLMPDFHPPAIGKRPASTKSTAPVTSKHPVPKGSQGSAAAESQRFGLVLISFLSGFRCAPSGHCEFFFERLAA